MKDLWRNHREGEREVKKTLESREVDVETGWFHICIAYIYHDSYYDILLYTSGILSYINEIRSPVNRLDGKRGGDGAFDCIINPSGRRTKALVMQRRTCVLFRSV